MGQSQSSPSPAAPASTSKHVFTAATPINFSAELIDSLQSSSETNSTRAKSLDLHIAQRVHEELAKLQSSQDSALQAAKDKILAAKDELETDTATVGKKVKDHLPEGLGGQGKEEKERKEQTSQKVAEEIERLKRELGQRKVLKELPGELERAREGVVSCLRTNDRRPLDCWREVEVFKREVRRLEEEFVGRVL